jgi:hypothetical protein
MEYLLKKKYQQNTKIDKKKPTIPISDNSPFFPLIIFCLNVIFQQIINIYFAGKVKRNPSERKKKLEYGQHLPL